MAAGNAIGTMAVLAIPSILDVLIYTKGSSVPKTAYKRYVETVLHLISWYMHDLTPGSRYVVMVTAIPLTSVRYRLNDKIKYNSKHFGHHYQIFKHV